MNPEMAVYLDLARDGNAYLAGEAAAAEAFAGRLGPGVRLGGREPAAWLEGLLPDGRLKVLEAPDLGKVAGLTPWLLGAFRGAAAEIYRLDSRLGMRGWVVSQARPAPPDLVRRILAAPVNQEWDVALLAGRLRRAVDESEPHLRAAGLSRWHEWFRSSLALLDGDPLAAALDCLAAYGGPGSFNDALYTAGGKIQQEYERCRAAIYAAASHLARAAVSR